MISIRNFTPDDYGLIEYWWKAHHEPAPTPGMLPPNTTFILEVDGVPTYCLSVYLTNSCIAYLENFIRSPDTKSSDGAKMLVDHAIKTIKDLGYEHVLCLAYKDKLKTRYQELGFIKTLDGICAFTMET